MPAASCIQKWLLCGACGWQGGGAGELLPLSGWMCLQQVCLEEAGLVLTGPPGSQHRLQSSQAGRALQGAGAAAAPLLAALHLPWVA